MGAESLWLPMWIIWNLNSPSLRACGVRHLFKQQKYIQTSQSKSSFRYCTCSVFGYLIKLSTVLLLLLDLRQDRPLTPPSLCQHSRMEASLTSAGWLCNRYVGFADLPDWEMIAGFADLMCAWCGCNQKRSASKHCAKIFININRGAVWF